MKHKQVVRVARAALTGVVTAAEALSVNMPTPRRVMVLVAAAIVREMIQEPT